MIRSCISGFLCCLCCEQQLSQHKHTRIYIDGVEMDSSVHIYSDTSQVSHLIYINDTPYYYKIGSPGFLKDTTRH